MKSAFDKMRSQKCLAAGSLATLLVVTTMRNAALADGGQKFGTTHVFIRSGQLNAGFTEVTLPLYRGTSQGQTVYYVITDSSSRADASARRVNYAPKLANARGTTAVQVVSVVNGTVDFPGSVDFAQNRVIVPGPTGFPPAFAQPGAVGQPAYSPLVEMPDGTVLNAPQIARDTNGDGVIDLATEAAHKVVAINIEARLLTYRLTTGFYDNRVVHYASFDSSNPVAAALEDVTWTPNLDATPSTGDSTHASAREGLIGFTNGQIGIANPERQGLSSALLDLADPLQTLEELPEGQSDPGFPAYSPLWDVHLAQWTPSAVAQGLNTRQTDFGTELNLAAQGLITS